MITWGICIYVVCVSFLLFRRQDFLQAVCLITSILGMVLLRFLRRYLVAYIILGYVVIAFLIIMTCRGYTFSKVHILLAIFLCFYAISESIFLRESQKKNLNSLLLVYLLVAVLCFWMPVTNQPYGWGFVENITNAIRETIQTVVAELDYQWNKTGNDGIYQIHFSGYSEEETSIRNPLEKRDVEQLFLEGKRTKGNLYLKGNVTNYFTGDSWRDTVKNPTMDISMDALMSMYAIYVYYNAECLRDAKVHYENAQSIQRFFDTYQYQITFRNLKTRSLFYPIKSIQIHADNQQCFGDNIRITSMNQRGYRYAVEFFDLDYQNSILRKILQTAAFVEYDEDLYNGMYEHMEQYFGVKMTKIPFDIFADTISKQEAEIQRIYGKDPRNC